MDLMLQTLISLVKWYSRDLTVGYCECIIGDFKLQIYSQIHDSWSWRICHLVGKDKIERELERSHKLHGDVQEAKDICIDSLYRIGKTFYGEPINWNNYSLNKVGSKTICVQDGEMIVTGRPDILIKIKNNMGEANERLPILFVIFKHPESERWHAKIVCKNNIGFTIWDSRWVYQKSGNYLNMQTAKEAMMICGEVYLTLIK